MTVKSIWLCPACGHTQNESFGSCPKCSFNPCTQEYETNPDSYAEAFKRSDFKARLAHLQQEADRLERMTQQEQTELQRYAKNPKCIEDVERTYLYFMELGVNAPKGFGLVRIEVQNILKESQDIPPQLQGDRVLGVLNFLVFGKVADAIENIRLQLVRRRVAENPEYGKLLHERDKIAEQRNEWQDKYNDAIAALRKETERLKEVQEVYESTRYAANEKHQRLTDALAKLAAWEKFSGDLKKQRGATLTVGDHVVQTPDVEYAEAVYVALTQEVESYKLQEDFLRKALQTEKRKLPNARLWAYIAGVVSFYAALKFWQLVF